MIDPTLFYSTYFGGDGADYASGIAVDGGGNAYVAGATDSTSVPGNSTFVGGFDSFVTKLDLNGALTVHHDLRWNQRRISRRDCGRQIWGIYQWNNSTPPTFPSHSRANLLGGGSTGANDAYAVKFDLNLSFLWGTCIGGSESDSGLGVAVDGAHNLYVVGETFSNDLGGTINGINALPSGHAVNLSGIIGNDAGSSLN